MLVQLLGERQIRRQIRVFLTPLLDRLDSCVTRFGRCLDQIVRAAQAEDKHQDHQQNHRRRTKPDDAPHAFVERDVLGATEDQAMFRKDLVAVKVVDEKRSRVDRLGRPFRDGNAGFRARKDVENRRTFLDRGREIESAEERRLQQGALLKDGRDVIVQWFAQLAETLGESNDHPEFFLGRLALQVPHPPIAEPVIYHIEGVGEPGRVVRLLEFTRARPAAHLVALLEIDTNFLEELAETAGEIHLRNQYKGRKTHAECLVHLPQPLAEDRRLLGAFLGIVTQQLVGRQRDHQPVHRTSRAVGLEQFEKIFPLDLVGRTFFLERDPAGSVENDGVIGKPPVVIPRAAEAGHLVLA